MVRSWTTEEQLRRPDVKKLMVLLCSRAKQKVTETQSLGNMRLSVFW